MNENNFYIVADPLEDQRRHEIGRLAADPPGPMTRQRATGSHAPGRAAGSGAAALPYPVPRRLLSALMGQNLSCFVTRGAVRQRGEVLASQRWFALKCFIEWSLCGRVRGYRNSTRAQRNSVTLLYREVRFPRLAVFP
jgi:hypothetical protein